MSNRLNSLNLTTMAISSQGAFRSLSKSPSSVRNQALQNISQMLRLQNHEVLEANRKDYITAKNSGMSDAMLDRLLLTPERLHTMSNDIINISELEDPIGETITSTSGSNCQYL
jgi:glutamate-5-semialdehyde dehydrogenase